jgi:hypothetical protein
MGEFYTFSMCGILNHFVEMAKRVKGTYRRTLVIDCVRVQICSTFSPLDQIVDITIHDPGMYWYSGTPFRFYYVPSFQCAVYEDVMCEIVRSCVFNFEKIFTGVKDNALSSTINELLYDSGVRIWVRR